MLDSAAIAGLIPALAKALIPYALKRVVESEPARRILQSRTTISAEADALLRQALPLALEGVDLPPGKIIGFLNCPPTLEVVCRWIVSDTPPEPSSDFEDLPLEAFSDPGHQRNQLETFAVQLAHAIEATKRDTFSVESLNILSGQARIEETLEAATTTFETSTTAITATLQDMPSQLREIIRSELDARLGGPGVADDRDDHGQAIEQIASLMEQGRIRTALALALEVEKEIEAASPIDVEALFLVRARISETYIESGQMETAVAYLRKAADIDTSTARKHRNRALALFYENRHEEALVEIDASLAVAPEKPQAINIKANLLAAVGDEEAMESLLATIAPAGNADLAFTAALLQHRLGRKGDALKSLAVAVEADPSLLQPYHLAVDIVVNCANADTSTRGIVRAETSQLFPQAIEYLERYRALLHEEQVERRAEAIAKRGAFHSWTNETAAARRCFEEAHRLLPDHAGILRNLALACWVDDDHDSALGYFRQLRELTPDDAEIDIIMAEVQVGRGCPAGAIEPLEERIEALGEDEEPDFRLHHALIRAYGRNYQHSEAAARLAEWQERYGDHPDLMVARADHLHTIGELPQAVQALEAAVLSAHGRLRTLAVVVLADLLLEEDAVRDLPRSLQLYEEVVNVYRPDRLLQKYAECLYECGELELCLEICNKAQAAGDGFIEPFAFMQARIYAENDHLLLATPILKRLAQAHPSHVSYAVNYGLCLFRSNRQAEAFEVARQARVKAECSRDLAFVSSAYESMGAYPEAVGALHTALQRSFDDPDLHLHYVATFHRATNAGYSPTPDEVAAFQDVLDEFNERFPEDGRLEKREVPADPDDMVQELRQLLGRMGRASQPFHDVYDNRRLPVAFLAKGLARDRLTTWASLTSRPSRRIWASSGNTEHHTAEVDLIMSAETVIVDLISLLTLEALNHLEALGDCFQHVIVPQAIFDELLEIIHRLEFLSQEEGMSIWEEDGSLYREDISPEQVRKTVGRLERICDFIASRCSLTGRTIGRQVDAELEQDLRTVIGDPATEVLLECHARSIPMYIDDMAMEYIGGNAIAVRGFCTRSLLDALLTKELISSDQFHAAVRALVGLNYHFTSVSAQTLMWSAASAGFDRTPQSMLPFDSLRHGDNSVPQLLDLSIGFLSLLWRGNLPLTIRQNWTDVLLFSITHRRDKRKLVGTIMRRAREVVPPVLPEVTLRDFSQTIDTWMAAQSIV